MDAIPYSCGNCNASLNIDLKTRTCRCDWCHQLVHIPRKEINAGPSVQSNVKQATEYFLNREFDRAVECAQGALAYAVDNAPAKYILAFYDRFIAKNRKEKALYHFFEERLIEQQSEPLDEDEINTLKDFFLASPARLSEHEEQILDLVRGNAQTSEELCAFVDAFSPSVIAKRNSIDYLTQELADIYMELAEDCNIPKTCYALLSSIRTNPDSPYPNETFYLRNKTQRFLHTYVHPIGDVIEAMQDEEMRQKFLTAYNKLEAQILEKMG